MSAVTLAYHDSAAAEADALAAHLRELGYGVETILCGDAGVPLGQRMVRTEGPLLLLVNDDLLHETACQVGFLEAYRRLRPRERFHPVMASTLRRGPGDVTARVLTSLARVSDVIRYMNYWQSAYLTRRRDLGSAASTTGAEELATIRTISQEIGDALRLIRADQPTDVRSLAEAGADEISALVGPPPERPVPESAAATADDTAAEAVDAAAETTPVEDPASGRASTSETPTVVSAAGLSVAAAAAGAFAKTEDADVKENGGDAAAASEDAGAGREGDGKGEGLSSDARDGDAPAASSNGDAAAEASPDTKEGQHRAMDPVDPADQIAQHVDTGQEEGPTDGVREVRTDRERTLPEASGAETPPMSNRDTPSPDEQSDERSAPRGATDEASPTDGAADAAPPIDEAAIAKLRKRARKLTRARNLQTFLAERDEKGFETAADFARSALIEDPRDHRLRYAFAVALLEHAEETDETVAEAREVIAPLFDSPLAAQAHVCLGQLALRRRDYGSARRHLTKALKLDKHVDPELPYRLGALLQDEFEDEPAKAIKYLRRAVKQSRANRADAHYRLGLLAWAAGRRRRAVRRLKLALDAERDHPFAAYDLAVIYRERNRPIRARDYFRQAIANNPELDTAVNRDAFAVTDADGAPTRLPETSAKEFFDFVQDRGIDNDSESPGAPDGLPVALASLLPDGDADALAGGSHLQDNDAEPLVGTSDAGHVEVPPVRRDRTDKILAAVRRLQATVDKLTGTTDAEEDIERDALVNGPPAPTALITGASSGIGAASARVFAKAGYRLVLTARRVDRLLALSNELQDAYGTEVRLLSFDVSDFATAERMIGSLDGEWAGLDVLVNNAGKARGLKPVYEMDAGEMDDMVDTNVKGLLYMTRLVGARMVARGEGHIINVCSTAGHEVYAGGTVYCGTKHAVDAITRGTRLDVFRHGVRVSQVSPAAVEETEFSKVRFDGDEERAAEVYEGWQPLRAEDVARQILAMAKAPKHVNVQDVVMLGTQQGDSTSVERSGRGATPPT